VRTFNAIEELRAEFVAFARRYNETWLVARDGYKVPREDRERSKQFTRRSHMRNSGGIMKIVGPTRSAVFSLFGTSTDREARHRGRLDVVADRH
jgi:hypothetical protein